VGELLLSLFSHHNSSKIRFIATGGVAWSVCWSRSWALQKRLNRSRCRFRWVTLVRLRNNVLDGAKEKGHCFMVV